MGDIGQEATVLSKANFIKDAAEKLENTIYSMVPSQATLAPNAPEEKVSGINEISAVLDSAHNALRGAQCFLDNVIRPKLGI